METIVPFAEQFQVELVERVIIQERLTLLIVLPMENTWQFLVGGTSIWHGNLDRYQLRFNHIVPSCG